MTWPVVIGIAGKAQSGKDTVARHIQNKSRCQFFFIVSFADRVKQVASKLYNFPLDWCYNKEGKERIVHGKSVRYWLQLVGETMREIDSEIWIRPVLDTAKHKWVKSHICTVIPDVRYTNEVRHIKSMGIPNRVIKLIRTDNEELNEEEASHSSETELDAIPESEFDAVFEAESGDVSGLLAQVDGWLKEVTR